MPRTLIVGALLIVAVAMLYFSYGSTDDSSAGSGKMAPEIGINSENGPMNLSQQKGKVVLLDFWATWCPPCRESIPIIDSLYRKYKSQGFTVMGVALERENDPNFFDKARSLGASYPVGLPISQESVANYPTQGIPYVALIDKQGRIRYTHDGYSPDEQSEFEKEINTLISEK